MNGCWVFINVQQNIVSLSLKDTLKTDGEKNVT